MRSRTIFEVPRVFLILGTLSLTILLHPVMGVAKEHQVIIENMKFVPEVIEVQKGDAILWINRDLVPHTVTAKPKFDSGMLASDKTFRLKPSSGGIINYVCLYHPMMKGKIIVKESR